ncbi:MAG: heavy metal-binding domain-containing protein [Isosphaeraceae bacterium]
MRMRLRTMTLFAILVTGTLLATPARAHAQGCCGGGGGYSGSRGAWGGHTFYAGGYRGGSYCNMNMAGMGMSMDMGMGGMQMGAMPMNGSSMQGMSMTGMAAPAAPAQTTGFAPAATAPAASPAPAASATYYCPMHPNVMSTFPATCPYCQMALKRR